MRDILIKIGKEIWFCPRLCFGVFKSIHATTQTKLCSIDGELERLLECCESDTKPFQTLI